MHKCLNCRYLSALILSGLVSLGTADCTVQGQESGADSNASGRSKNTALTQCATAADDREVQAGDYTVRFSGRDATELTLMLHGGASLTGMARVAGAQGEVFGPGKSDNASYWVNLAFSEAAAAPGTQGTIVHAYIYQNLASDNLQEATTVASSSGCILQGPE